MEDTADIVKELANIYGRDRISLLAILQGVAQKQQYLTDEAMVEVARELDISTAEVYGVCSFYSFLSSKPLGRYTIRICRTIVCEMNGKNQIIKTLENLLKIKVGETTQNRKFSLLETNCLGWCHKGPAMLINDEVFTELTPEKVREIIAEYRAKP